MNGRSRASVLTRSSGAARLIFDRRCIEPRAARRSFDRAARDLRGPVIVDLSAIGIPSSAAWGAIAAGVRDLVRRGNAVTVHADAGLARLFAISGFARDVCVVLRAGVQAA